VETSRLYKPLIFIKSILSLITRKDAMPRFARNQWY